MFLNCFFFICVCACVHAYVYKSSLFSTAAECVTLSVWVESMFITVDCTFIDPKICVPVSQRVFCNKLTVCSFNVAT
jgi:hypothetical protein